MRELDLSQLVSFLIVFNLRTRSGHRQVIDAIKLGFKPSLLLFTERAISISDDSSSRRNIKQELFDIINDNIGLNIDSVNIQEVTEDVMKSITDTVSNQGINLYLLLDNLISSFI